MKEIMSAIKVVLKLDESDNEFDNEFDKIKTYMMVYIR